MIEKFVKEKLSLVLVDLPPEIDPDQDLSELGMDSLRYISLIVLLEEELGAEFEDDLLFFDKMNTINKIKSAWEAACHETGKHD